jgi:hypothetical protein
MIVVDVSIGGMNICSGVTYLPSGKRQFSIAKIAVKITDLRFGRTFDLTEVVEHPVELVRCLKTQQQTIIRAAIA